jgi:predicted acetyltransferase
MAIRERHELVAKHGKFICNASQGRKGLGTTLLSLAFGRARQTTSKKILIYAAGHNVGSNAFSDIIV